MQTEARKLEVILFVEREIERPSRRPGQPKIRVVSSMEFSWVEFAQDVPGTDAERYSWLQEMVERTWPGWAVSCFDVRLHLDVSK